MITLAEAKSLVEECEHELQGAFFKSLSCIGEKRWLLEFDQPSERARLFVCLKKPFSRFHLTTAPYNKGPSQWAPVVEKSLKGAILESCRLLGGDRILELVLNQEDTCHYILFELFSSQAYLLDAARKILASTPKKKEGVYTPPPLSFEPQDLEVVCTSAEIEAIYLEREEANALKEKKERLERALQKKIKRAQGQITRAQEGMREAESWQEKEHLAQLLKTNFSQIKRGMRRIELSDWEKEGKLVEISLDPALLPKEQVDRFFKKARKLKKGVPHVEILLGKREDELNTLQKAHQELASLQTYEELEAFSNTYHLIPPPSTKKACAEPKKRLPYRTFTTKQGMIIHAGKSDKDGDTLTFTLANGSDYWFHVATYPGSHVVLKCPKGVDPDRESLRDAALIALYFSKAKKGGSDEITVTQVKHVSKPRGAKPGLVTISRHKKMLCRLDQKRLDRLFESGEKR